MKSIVRFVASRLEKMSDTQATILVNIVIFVATYAVVLSAMYLIDHRIGIAEMLKAMVIAVGLILVCGMFYACVIAPEIRWYRWNKH